MLVLKRNLDFFDFEIAYQLHFAFFSLTERSMYTLAAAKNVKEKKYIEIALPASKKRVCSCQYVTISSMSRFPIGFRKCCYLLEFLKKSEAHMLYIINLSHGK